MNDTNQPFRFLDMPYEMRYHIYEIILQPDRTEPVMDEVRSRASSNLRQQRDEDPPTSSRFAGCTAIARTCKFVSIEISAVLKRIPHVIRLGNDFFRGSRRLYRCCLGTKRLCPRWPEDFRRVEKLVLVLKTKVRSRSRYIDIFILI